MLGCLLGVASIVIYLAWFGSAGPAAAQSNDTDPREILLTWNHMVLQLTRHTPTYTPPVASRTYAYLGVTAFEAVASGSDKLQTLAGQLNGFAAIPLRQQGAAYHEAILLQAAMSAVIRKMFENTGPTGQRAFDAQRSKLDEKATFGVPEDVVARSQAYGASLAAHVLAWAQDDGGATIVNMGFPADYKLIPGSAHWVPTGAIVQQQTPLLPEWGKSRTFATPSGKECAPPPPPAYSEDPASDFYREAKEVYDTKNGLTPDQAAIARFWSDDPMLSWTPPGHWMSILEQVLRRDDVPLEDSVDILARLSIAEADAFIGCWDTKYEYDLVRPITYIRRVIDPKWETLINTPPFPEYTSGHSVASAAAATVLTAFFGENFAFDDDTGNSDGLTARSFASFWDAANQAGISRLYGGIHYRAAIEHGLAQGRCIGAHAVGLKTKR
jgi:hypothetical protein